MRLHLYKFDSCCNNDNYVSDCWGDSGFFTGGEDDDCYCNLLVLKHHYAMLLNTMAAVEMIITISNAQLDRGVDMYNYFYFYYFTKNNDLNG